MIPILVTAPTDKVVTIQDLMAHLRIVENDEIFQVEAIEKAAVAHLDGWRGVLGRCIMPQTWRQDFPDWGKLRIAMPDASDVTVTYRDAEGVFQPATGAETGIDALGPFVEVDGPDTSVVRVTYICAMPAEQRPAAQMAVKLYAEHLYDGSDLSPAFHALVSAMRWRSV